MTTILSAASYESGLSFMYSYFEVTEKQGRSKFSSYYFLNNNKSVRHSLGSGLYFYRKIGLGKYLNLGIGPYFNAAKIILDKGHDNDSPPDGFSADGSYLLGLGLDFKLTFIPHRKINPYIRIGLGFEWNNIDWEADLTYFGVPEIVFYTEESFGFSYRVSVGISFNIDKLVSIFFDPGFYAGYFTASISGKYSDVIPQGNKYKYMGFKITSGILLKFSSSKRSYKKENGR